MLFKRKFANLVIAFILVFSSFGISETSTLYTREDNDQSSFTINLKGNQEERNTTVKFPATDVLDASFVVSPSLGDESPESISIGISDYEWKYDASGYGALGNQKRFVSDSISSSATFSSAGEEEISLYIPTNSTITSAKVNLTGLPYGSGELDDYNLASTNTNGGSVSIASSLEVNEGNYYTLWVDDGNLDTRGNGYYNLIFRSYTSDSWNEPFLLREWGDDEGLGGIYYPALSASDDLLVAFWMLDLGAEVFQMSYSTNGGNSWSTPTDAGVGNEQQLYGFDMVVDSSDTIHLVWCGAETGDANWNVFYSKSSDNGNTWSDQVTITGQEANSLDSTLVQSDGKVHVVWREADAETGYYETRYSISDDNGETFSSGSKLSGSGDLTVTEVTVTASGSDVVVAWAEIGSTSTQTDLKSRSSSNSGSSFSSEQTASNGNDFTIDYLDSSNDGDNDYFLGWSGLDFDLNYVVNVARSANKGSSWNTPVNVDGLEDEDYRSNVQIDVDQTEDEVVVTWVDRTDETGASSDDDIHYTKSDDNGLTWEVSPGNRIQHISEYYYEADSSNPAIAYSDNSLYLCYIDDGDYDQEGDSNGNDARVDDGDIVFRRSDDGGENWNLPTVISNQESDAETELTYRIYNADNRCDISASNNDVHIVWTQDDILGYSDVYISSSKDKGETWSAPIIVNDDNGEGYKYSATITSNEDHVVTAWSNGVFGSNDNYDIYISYSQDSGDSWSEHIKISDDSGDDYLPEIVYNQGKYHVVWQGSVGGWEIQYSYTSDGGETWSNQKSLNGDKSDSFGQASIAAHEDTLYVSWMDGGSYDGKTDNSRDLVGIISTDNGVSWGEDKLILDTDNLMLYKFPSLSSGPGFTYLTYQDYSNSVDASEGYDYFFIFSQDGGGTWSDSFEITDHDSEDLDYFIGNKMDTIVADKAYFAFEEQSNVFDEEDEDLDIYVRTTKSDDYPTNPYVKLGSSNDWEYAGEFNEELTWNEAGDEAVRSFKTVIEEALQDAISAGDTIVDEYGIEMTEIILKVGSSSKGTVGFNDLEIIYEVDLVISSSKLVDALNSEVQIAVNNNQDIVETAIKINSETPGKLILKDLSIKTTVAELSISDLTFSGELKEGSTLYISAKITNSGEGDADVDFEIWANIGGTDEYISASTVADVPGGGSKTIQSGWQDVPVGTHEITVRIVDSMPKEDEGEDDDNEVTESVTINSASSNIDYTFSTTSVPVENRNNEWTLLIENKGDKYCECIVYLYINDEEGILLRAKDVNPDNDLSTTDQTKIEIDEIRPFTGNWIPEKSVNNLYLKIEDTSGDGNLLVDEIIEIQIKKLPDLKVSRIVWVDSVTLEETDSFSDGIVVVPQIFVMNDGSFDLTATAEITMTNGIKDLTVDYSGEIDPGYGSIMLPAGQESQIKFKDVSGEYITSPVISLFSGGEAGFIGDWSVNIRFANIKPVNSEDEEFWDSEELTFEDDSQKIEITTPPSLSIESFTSSSTNIKEGQAVTLTIEIMNEGGASATGELNIKQGSTKLTNTTFTIEGEKLIEIEVEYSVPKNYDGELTLIAEIDRNSVSPSVGPLDLLEDDSQTLTIDVEGTVVMPEASDSGGESSSGDLIVPLVAGFVMLVGGAGAFFFYRRSQAGEVEDVFGDPGITSQESVVPPALPQSEQPPAVAPPQPEQPPAAAPPQPEQPPAAAPPQPEQPPAAPTLLSITVPQGVQPGQQIQIKAPDGRLVSVTVPEGLQPGSQFQVKI